MTSLAKQLERLAVPQTQAVFGEDKRKKSLLFDPKEAASLDKETFFGLGTNGLEELQTIDPSFEEFEDNLFADSSLTFERSIQTKEVNDKLDETISRFLFRLSPYCLLKPAHKAIEWLIYRYHIHHYNVDSLVLSMLPYHESKIFVRVVQLIKLNSKTATKWDWLADIQKTGVHLTRSALVKHCRSDLGFMGLVCDTIAKVIMAQETEDETFPPLRTWFAFYTTTVIGVMETGPVRDEFIAFMLPHFSQGLKSSIPNYKAGTYMILAQLFHKVTLKEKLLSTLMNTICKYIMPEFLSEALSCLLLMFQSQDISEFSKRSFKKLCEHPSLIDKLVPLCNQFKSDKLQMALLTRLVPAAVKPGDVHTSASESADSDAEGGGALEKHVLLHKFLSGVTLDEKCGVAVIKDILERLMKYGGQYDDEHELREFCNKYTATMRMLESKYPTLVDRSMEEILQNADSEDKQKLMETFINQMVFSVHHHLFPESDMSLTLAVNHRLSTIREKAVTYMLENLEETPDDDFTSTTLLCRLGDDVVNVVKAALEFGSKLWTLVKEKDELVKVLQKLLDKANEEKEWQSIMPSLLEALCSCEEDTDDEVIDMILPLFLFVNKETYEYVTVILKSPLGRRNIILHSINTSIEKRNKTPAKGHKKKTDSVELEEFIEYFAHGLLQYKNPQRDKLLEKWCSSVTSIKGQSLMLLVLDQFHSNVKSHKEKNFICEQLISLMKKTELTGAGEITTVSRATEIICQEIADDKRVSCTLVLSVLNKMPLYISIPKKLTDAPYWHYKATSLAEDQTIVLLVELFDYILGNSAKMKAYADHFQQLVTEFIGAVFPETELFFRFLGMVWTHHCNVYEPVLNMPVTLQTRALQIGNIILRAKGDSKELGRDYQTTVIMNLLLTATSPNKLIRQLAMECMYTADEKLDDHPFKAVLKKAMLYLQEIIDNYECILGVTKAVFKSLKEEDDEGTPKKKKRRSSKQLTKSESLTAMLDIVTDTNTPDYIQKYILKLLASVNKKTILTTLLPKLQHDLKALSGSHRTHAMFDCCKLILARFTDDYTDIIEDQGLPVLIEALNCEVYFGHEINSLQIYAINLITDDLYSSLKPDSQKKILTVLYTLWTETDSVCVTSAARNIFPSLSVDGEHVADELEKCLVGSSAGTLKEAKRKKSKPTETEKIAEFDQPSWQRVNVILESVQGNKKLDNSIALLPVCFKLMASILESDDHTSAEYIKQLILELIHDICCKASSAETQNMIPEQMFNMELIVNCVRSSINPQTHHQALLVLTVAAELYPEKLLHNIMSVFTFMGDTMVRQDDSYSFQIINRILEKVIPALVTACGQRKKVKMNISNDPDDIITMVIRVFVDAFPHIPIHRRLMLFTKLVSIEGDNSYLWRTLLLMTEQVVSKMSSTESAEEDPVENTDSVPDTEFRLNFCGQFSLPVQLSTVKHIIDYLERLPDDKQTDLPQTTIILPKSLGQLKKDDAEIFNVLHHTSKQLRHFRYEAIQFLISIFSHKGFLEKVSKELTSDLLDDFQKLMQSVMTYLVKLSKSVQKHQDTSTAKYWRAIFNKICELLDKVVTILPENLCLQAISGLMSHELSHVKRKAMELLNNRLLQQKTFTEEEEALLLPMVDQLCEVVTNTTLKGEMTEENAVNGQSAFYSLKLMSRHLGNKYRHTFTKVIKLSIKVFKTRNDNLQVAACALLCVAELCNSLKAHALPHLPAFMPLVIKEMKNDERLVSNDLYMLSIVTAIQKVVENLSLFISPYLEDIVMHVCSISIVNRFANKNVEKPQLQQRLKSIRQVLATTLSPRVLLPTIASCYRKLEREQDIVIICSLMSLLEAHITAMSKEDLTAHIQDLHKFFLDGLNFRFLFCEHQEKDIATIEGSIIEAFVTMVMKLSESTFKTLLFKLFDWASRDEDTKYRVMVFYRLADRLAEKLRSLFTLFASHIVQHAASVLEKNNSAKEVEPYFCKGKRGRRLSNQLICYIADCLYKCFLYDTEGFVTKERFDSLMQPLVDQLENYNDKDKHFEERITDHLVPCIVQFAASSQDDSLWKTINYQILLKTRHESPKVRFAALQCIDEFHKKLGEEYMPLLPEAIPFLAELMEDDSEEVEKKCQTVIAEMEKTLGEPLKKYF